VAPANQIHDFNPGFSSQGVFWTVAVPDSSVQVNPLAGTAELKVTGLAIEDYGKLSNALADGPSVEATVSFDVVWSRPVTQRLNVSDPTHTFAGEYAVNQASLAWSASESGFTFTSSPASTTTSLFAETGHERNGIFFQ
jgi:hypothetical protein